ncbi:exodeoxyribonuclease VII large subunit [Lactobacillus sp. S2-2]|nr:exodeoxyribonuclease VII large subunit [Lactobacillus sp. S2-2]
MTNEYLSVTTLTKYLKSKFDLDPYLKKVYLTGEISNFRLRQNSSQYFSLKDDDSKINVIMFRNQFNKVKFVPEEGMKVLVTGRISLYEKTGNYQFYIEQMEPDGIGQLYKAYEQLKEKLSQENLFNTNKQNLIKFPKRIAVVTSESGAVIKDIITTVRRRYPIAQIVLFPAKVQGESAAEDITRQINRVNEIGDFDTLIIGRGGGSIEDLWPFNEEIVARSIYASKVPIISSVGHETDTTIADLVADVRAATPTAAAELAVPVLNDVILEISKNKNRLSNSLKVILNQYQKRLDNTKSSYIFTQPERLYESYIQQIDTYNEKMKNIIKILLQNKLNNLVTLENKLAINSPKYLIEEQKNRLNNTKKNLNRNIKVLYSSKKELFLNNINSLEYLSPLKIMSRGYTYASKNGKVVQGISKINTGDDIKLNFSDGDVDAKILKINPKGDS